MRLTTIYETADKIAPFVLSEEYIKKYGMHDNSGVLIDCGEETHKILFSLDLSARAIERAKETGANCIFTHHPAIFNPLYALHTDGAGKHILACARAGISVLSAHLNLDCAVGGIDESLMHGLGGKKEENLMHALTGGGYGRVYSVEEKSAAEFVEEVEKRFLRIKCFYTETVPFPALRASAWQAWTGRVLRLRGKTARIRSSRPIKNTTCCKKRWKRV